MRVLGAFLLLPALVPLLLLLVAGRRLGLAAVVAAPRLIVLPTLPLGFLLLLALPLGLLQLPLQLALAQLRQRGDIILAAVRARATHVQDDLLVGIDLDEIATLIGQVPGVAAFLAGGPHLLLVLGD